MTDFAAEGLLEGLDDDEARAARLDLLEQLSQAGVRLDELRQAVAEDRLALLPVERLLGGDSRYTAAEVAERSGLDVDFLERHRRALGLPLPDLDEPALDDDDLKAAGALKQLRDAGLSDDGLLEITRVWGESMSRAAAAARTFIGDELIAPGDTERDVGLRYVDAARQLGPTTGPMLEYIYSRHLREQLRSDVVDHGQLEKGRMAGVHEVTVCFADLVGFTKLGESVPADELGGVAGRLAAMAGEAVRPPVRLIKMIGDAAMLVARETEPVLEVSLELVAAADACGDDFPQLRAGLARGQALHRWGDWYGESVNLASRVTAVARPGSVLATESVHEVAEGAYRWSFAGKRRLKGVHDEVALYRARHLEPEEADDDG